MTIYGSIVSCAAIAGRVQDTVDNYDTVDVVWHHDAGIKGAVIEPSWQIQPCLLDQLPDRAQYHLIADYLAKQTLSLMRDNRNEIRTRLRIIVTLQADGSPVVS